MSNVYYVLPNNFKGTVLKPLGKSQIDLHSIHIKRYDNIRSLLNRYIFYLDVYWSDVVIFSSVNPDLIYKALNNLGFNCKCPRYISIPSKHLDNTKTVIYHNSGLGSDYSDQYSVFLESKYTELSKVPKRTLDYYRKCHKEGRLPRPLFGVPYVLTTELLDIETYLS